MQHDDRRSSSATGEDLKDPMSGYARGDALDPQPRPNPPQAEDLQDPMSGYVSGDVLDPRERINQPAGGGAGADVKDPMSGYASADALETKEDNEGQSLPTVQRRPSRLL